MPWPAKQRTAIFLGIKRRKGEKAAKTFMHKHGYGGKKKHHDAISKALSGRK